MLQGVYLNQAEKIITNRLLHESFMPGDIFPYKIVSSEISGDYMLSSGFKPNLESWYSIQGILSLHLVTFPKPI